MNDGFKVWLNQQAASYLEHVLASRFENEPEKAQCSLDLARNIGEQVDRLIAEARKDEWERCARECERGEGAVSHGRYFAERIRDMDKESA